MLDRRLRFDTLHLILGLCPHLTFTLTQTPRRNRTPTLERAHTHQISEGRLALHLDPRPALVSPAERPSRYTQKSASRTADSARAQKPFLTNFLKTQVIQVIPVVSVIFPFFLTTFILRGTHFAIRAQLVNRQTMAHLIYFILRITSNVGNRNSVLYWYLYFAGAAILRF